MMLLLFGMALRIDELGIHTWSILGDHTVNDGSFDTVDDIVACARYVVAVTANLYFLLLKSFSD